MAKYEPKGLTATEVKEYRELTGASMMDTKRFLKKLNFLNTFGQWRREATTEDKLEFILDWIYEKETK